MTVIVKYDSQGKPQYQSAKGIGSTEAERARARELDALLKTELIILKHRLAASGLWQKSSKAKVELYWELGIVLRKVFFDSHLVDNSEKHLYWLNARIHVPEELLAIDRGPNRSHLEYCFRLAGFPKNKAIRMKWSEWVYLFDSLGINREQRFDRWLESKIEGSPDKFSRDDIRILAQAINKLLGNIETHDLSDEQLERCYEAAWLIKENFVKRTKELPHDQLKEALRHGIEKYYSKLGSVISGNQEPATFALLISEEITAK